METGIVCGPGVYSDIELEDRTVHPVTGVPIDGFILPFWKETVDMIRHAAILYRGNQSVGWDIAITDQGPELIEEIITGANFSGSYRLRRVSKKNWLSICNGEVTFVH